MLESFPFFVYYFISVWAIYLFDTYLNYRQHRTFLTKERPREIVDIVDQEKFIKAQNYGRDKSTFSFVSDAFNQIKDSLVWYFFIVAWLWNRCGGFAEKIGHKESEIVQSLIFLTINFVVEDLIGLPFSLYSTFVIEEMHGFNKQTLKLFFVDKIKGYGLMLVIGIPLITLFLKIIQWGGEYFYIYLSVFLFAVQMLMVTIYPVLIQPCFNKVTELPEGELRTKIEELAKDKRVLFPLKKLFEIDGSKRSAHSNAYFYGFCNNKRIVLYDTLIKQSTSDEVVAVLGHEFGHWKLNHTIIQLVLSQIQSFLIFFLFSQVINNQHLYQSFGFNTKPTLIGFMLFGNILVPFNQILSFLMTLLTRKFEFQADHFAVTLGYGSLLKDALIKLQKENLGAMNPDWLYSTFNYSHPPLVERLKGIENGGKQVD